MRFNGKKKKYIGHRWEDLGFELLSDLTRVANSMFCRSDWPKNRRQVCCKCVHASEQPHGEKALFWQNYAEIMSSVLEICYAEYSDYFVAGFLREKKKQGAQSVITILLVYR